MAVGPLSSVVTPYLKLTPEQKAIVAKYGVEHDVVRAIRRPI